MSVQLSVAVRNARLDAIESTTGTSAKLTLYTGAPPANCATAPSGTLLDTVSLPSDWMANASSGSKAMSGSWSGAAGASGTAGYFRITDTAGTTCHMQGTVTATGGGGDMTIDNNVLASGQGFSVTTFTITDANA